MNPRIVVIGSLNADFVINLSRFPVPGETLVGRDFKVFPGGKGANQAYAVGRLGGNVSMVGQVGNDTQADFLKQNLASVGVDVSHVYRDPNVSSGIATITIDESGQNQIVIIPGSNGTFTPDLLARAEPLIASAGFVLLQLEIPLPTVLAAARLAKKSGATVILDPAPAAPLADVGRAKRPAEPSSVGRLLAIRKDPASRSVVGRVPIPGVSPELERGRLAPAPQDVRDNSWNSSLLSCVDYLTPNETELGILTGSNIQNLTRDLAAAKAAELLALGAKKVIVKMGAQGALLVDGKQNLFFPALKVKAVDTTAAGDAFNAGFAYTLANGGSESDACAFATATAAFSVTKPGAQPSMPTKAEVENLLRK